MLNQNSKPFAQIQYFIKAGMFREAIITYSKLRDGVTNESELLSDKFFQRDLKEAEYSLIKLVRDQIQDIHRLMERNDIRYAFARCMQLVEILDVEPTRRYFTEYLYELHELLEQLNNERRAEQGIYEIQRLVEHHELNKAIHQLQILRDEVHPRSRFRREIE